MRKNEIERIKGSIATEKKQSGHNVRMESIMSENGVHDFFPSMNKVDFMRSMDDFFFASRKQRERNL